MLVGSVNLGLGTSVSSNCGLELHHSCCCCWDCLCLLTIFAGLSPESSTIEAVTEVQLETLVDVCFVQDHLEMVLAFLQGCSTYCNSLYFLP